MHVRWIVSLCSVVLALGVLAPALGRAQAMMDLNTLRTRPERTQFAETTRYDEVVAFLDAVASASPRIHLTTFGYSFEGRPLPLAVVGAEGAGAEAVRATGKTRVFIQANIHAGEVEGKEALLLLLRSLAQGEHRDWTDSLVLLIAPIYNADGNERVSLVNRPLQHGPIGGMGQRPNAQGYDLNRDHMKLDSPEARSLVRLMQLYDPHVAVDLHTTNGTFHGYHLTYAPPLNPNTDSTLVRHLRQQWLPAVTRAIKVRNGWDYYYYGNVPSAESPWAAAPGAERGWYTFDHRPRFNNNYVGLRNRFAILSEAYSYLTFEERIVVTQRFVEEILDYAAANASSIRRLTAEADARSIVGRSLAVRSRPERSAAPVEILMGEVREERNPFSGERMLRRLEVRRPERMPEYGTFTPTETERAPRAYLVPAELAAVRVKLEEHGIRFSPLEQPLTLAAEHFRIASSTQAEQPFQGHRERTLAGAYDPPRRITIPAGTLVVPVEQPLGRLAFYLLEPRSDDGLVNWAVLDDALEGAELYPILRTHEVVR